MERAWGLSLEEGLWVQRLARPLDWSRVALLPWVGMPGNLTGTHDPCQQSPGQNPGDVQGCAQCAPQSSSGGSTLLTPPPSRPGLQAASWRPVVSTDSPRRFSTTGCGPVAPGGAPWTLILSLLHALGRHFQQGLRRPRPSPALPAGGPCPASPAPPAIAAEEPRVPLWASGCQAHAPCPPCRGAPTSWSSIITPHSHPPERDSAFRSTGLRSP